MSSSSAFIPAGSLVLVTGINSYIGAQVARELLEVGYKVRGTVRNEAKAKQYLESVPTQYKSAVSTATVHDLISKRGLDEAMKGVAAVVHVASPFHYHPTDNERDLLLPAVKGTQNVLDVVGSHEQVRRVVVLSSFAAVVDLSQGRRAGYTYNEKDWNPVTWEQAVSSTDAGVVYCASKTFAEKSAWAAVTSKSLFDVVCINPPMVFGPSAFPPNTAADLGTSLAQFWDAVSGEKEIPETDFPVFVDVRDVAAACRLALEVKEAGGQRFLTCAGNFTYDGIAAMVKEQLPEAPTRSPQRPLHPDSYSIDSTKSQVVLGLAYRKRETTFLDTARQLLHVYSEQKVD